MFHHVKDLQFNARVSRPDPRSPICYWKSYGGLMSLAKTLGYYEIASYWYDH
jgi:Mn-containing catalase